MVQQCSPKVRVAWERLARKPSAISESAGLVDEVMALCHGSSSAVEKEFGISLKKIATKSITYNKAYNVSLVLSKMNALAENLRLAA